MITVIGVANMTTVEHTDAGWLGSRIGMLHDGVDACWCNPVCFMGVDDCWGNPVCFMGVNSVEINLTWS